MFHLFFYFLSACQDAATFAHYDAVIDVVKINHMWPPTGGQIYLLIQLELVRLLMNEIIFCSRIRWRFSWASSCQLSQRHWLGCDAFRRNNLRYFLFRRAVNGPKDALHRGMGPSRVFPYEQCGVCVIWIIALFIAIPYERFANKANMHYTGK